MFLKIRLHLYNIKLDKLYKWDGIGDQIGGHAIKILGWGVENGIAYWGFTGYTGYTGYTGPNGSAGITLLAIIS